MTAFYKEDFEDRLMTSTLQDPSKKHSMEIHHLAYRRLKRSPIATLLGFAVFLLAALWLRHRLVSTGYSLLPFFGSNAQGSVENMTLVILPRTLADERGAYCLDGSPPSYYIRKAKSTKTQASWLVVLQGGGWCWNASDCYQRSLSELGSSYQLPKEIQFDGVMSGNSTVNPEFYDWNMVMINYCDGASFSGNLASPVKFKESVIYYRGARVLKLVLDYLLKSVGLVRAKRVILGGVSAGGLAVYLHGDYIRDLIPAGIPVHCIVDAGFFLDERNISDYNHYRTHMTEILAMQNAEGSLNHNCLKAISKEDKWKCFFAEYTYPYITTPLFIINSAYDYWQQWFILDLRCHPIQCPDKLPFLTKHHSLFIKEIEQVHHNHANDGMFISSCYAHSQAFHDDTWMTYKVGEKTTRQAFGDWYFGRTTPKMSRYLDCSTDYYCNPSCSNSWTLAFYKNTTDRMKSSTPDF